MKKLNNKGITLVELIVSFALVAVACVYFFQTIYTIKKLYANSRKETNNYINVNYAYRIVDEIMEESIINHGSKPLDSFTSDKIANYQDSYLYGNEISPDCNLYGNKIYCSFEINGDKYYLYK